MTEDEDRDLQSQGGHPIRGLLVGLSLSLAFWAFVFAWFLTS